MRTWAFVYVSVNSFLHESVNRAFLLKETVFTVVRTIKWNTLFKQRIVCGCVSYIGWGEGGGQ